MSIPNCPKCQSEYAYEDQGMFICPMCQHEWNELSEEEGLVKDINNNVLEEGDRVSVVKDLKIKGTPTLKQGTIVRNIKLRSDFDENVICKVDGIGTLYIKSEYLKKV